MSQQFPILMGILNVTPDSFSDGGRFLDTQKAIGQAHRMIEEGASIIDIGGESTRPGAVPVGAGEEMARVLPVIEGLKGCGTTISIDTRHAVTMRAAVAAGATMINDVSALRHDPNSLQVAAESKARICLMHMQGTPQDMQKNPSYQNVVPEVFDFLRERIAVCEAAGIEKSRLIVDPGIGFGKTFDHNISLIRNIAEFTKLGAPVLLGVSRKSFIEKICPGSAPDQRVAGSVAAALWAWSQGATIFRVHDVAQTAQAFRVMQAVSGDF